MWSVVSYQWSVKNSQDRVAGRQGRVEYVVAYWERGHPCPPSAIRRSKAFHERPLRTDCVNLSGSASLIFRAKALIAGRHGTPSELLRWDPAMPALPASGGSLLSIAYYGYLPFAPNGAQRTSTAPQQSCSAGDPAMPALPVRAAYSTRRVTSSAAVL
jgi:hypothetical protein